MLPIEAALIFAAAASFAVTEPEVKSITAKIFPDLRRVECRTLSRGPNVSLEATDPTLAAFANQIVKRLETEQWGELKPMFHPLLKVKDDVGETIAATLRHKYEKPWQYSVYRTWAIHTVNGDPSSVRCDDGASELITRYGYTLQIGLWLQLMAPNEIGRIFVLIVPSEKDWRIGGWHISQWSHRGKDAEYWAKEAQAAATKGEKITAYLKYDLAQKLLDVGGIVNVRAQDEYIAARNAQYMKSDMLASLNATLKTTDVVYVGSIFADDGAGLALRERLKEALPTPDLQRRCIQRGKTLISEKVLTSDLGGLRCSYVLPTESPDHDGEAGGFFYSRKDIQNKTL